MSEAVIPPLALHGWYMLTQLVRISHRDGRVDMERGFRDLRALGDLIGSFDDLGDDGWSAAYHLVGGRADFLIVHLRQGLDALGAAERTLRSHPGGACWEITHDYVSVVELGLYGHTLGLAKRAEREGIEIGSAEWAQMVDDLMREQMEKEYTLRRLYPRQPAEMTWVCFYPMNKRRNVGQNWYTLGLSERARLMQEHGSTGRKYAGKVSQIITASVGLDEWEWAVTLFAADPIQFKELVTEMRYDEVTSVYGEFGNFWVGQRIAADGIGQAFAEAIETN